ncbi:MAG TPA: response regulator [Planctomycetota bacterium]|nr:response regulator [Planctomycetota bacterium]
MATVLIVDDEMYIRMFLRGTLEAMGHQVIGEAGDGLSAIDRTRELQPQVVLLDVVMPGADGITILPALRAAAPSAQIVLTTSIDPVRCGVLTNIAGLAGFLTKPVDPQDLRRVLTRITAEEPSSGIHASVLH